MEDIVTRLRNELGADAVLTGDEVRSRSVYWFKPTPNLAQAVVRPRSTAEVSQVLRACWEANQPVVPQGGLTGLVGGATPTERENDRWTMMMTPAASKRRWRRSASFGGWMENASGARVCDPQECPR